MSGNTAIFKEYGSDHEFTDPGTAGAIVPDRQRAVCPIVSSAVAETNTLPDPEFMGQECTICFKTDGGGDRTITAATGINQTGNNTMVFADAGDMIALQAIQSGSSVVWRVMANDGVALSTV
jgi:hypothetical protein